MDLTEETLLDDELLEEELFELLDDEEEAAAELEELFEELELAADELDELAATSGPTEHHALLLKLLVGNREVRQVKLPVSVAYTNEPDFPSATEWVPVMVQAPPTWAHLV